MSKRTLIVVGLLLLAIASMLYFGRWIAMDIHEMSVLTFRFA